MIEFFLLCQTPNYVQYARLLYYLLYVIKARVSNVGKEKQCQVQCFDVFVAFLLDFFHQVADTVKEYALFELIASEDILSALVFILDQRTCKYDLHVVSLFHCSQIDQHPKCLAPEKVELIIGHFEVENTCDDF